MLRRDTAHHASHGCEPASDKTFQRGTECQRAMCQLPQRSRLRFGGAGAARRVELNAYAVPVRCPLDRFICQKRRGNSRLVDETGRMLLPPNIDEARSVDDDQRSGARTQQ